MHNTTEKLTLRNRILKFSEWAMYWSVVAIPIVASFSSAAVQVFTGFTIGSFLLKKLLSKEVWIKNKTVILPLVLLVLISCVSCINSVSLRASAQGILKLVKYGLLLLIVAGEIKDRAHSKRIFLAILAGLLLASFDGIYQYVFGVDFFRHKPYDSMIGLVRLKAAFPHTNIFAGYLALFIPVLIPVFLYWFKGVKKFVVGLVILFSVFCLIFTFCRSAAFGFWFVLLGMALLRKDKVVIAIMLFTVILAPFIAPRNIKDWSKSTTSIAELLLNKERLIINETSFNMIRKHPLAGVGVNTYVLNYQRYKSHDTSKETAQTGWYAHNSYLQMASEIGLFGLAVFLWLLVLLVFKWFSFYRFNRDSFLGLCSLGVIMGVGAFLINGLTETNLYYPKIAILFWYELGFVLGLVRLGNNDVVGKAGL